MLKVERILDKTTVVITGSDLATMAVGSHVQVLAIGPALKDPAVPLLIPKCDLEITVLTKDYAIGRSLSYEEVEESVSIFSGIHPPPRRVRKRYILNADEKSLTGNPANEPIKVGDPVVIAGGLEALLEEMKDMPF